jgi:hypothetical protein
MKNSTISLFWNSSTSSSLYPNFSCVCLVANPNTRDNTWDQWQQQRQWLGSSNTFSRPFMDAWWQRGRRVGLKLCACSCSAGGGLTAQGRRSNHPTPASWEWDLVCNKWISTFSCELEYLYECYSVCRTYLCTLSDSCVSLWYMVYLMIFL